MPNTATFQQKPKTKREKAHLQAIVRQLTTEPAEIAKNALDQVLGTGNYDTEQNPAGQSSLGGAQEKPLTTEQILAKQKKDSSHMQAFQEEMRVIERLQKQRDEERKQTRALEEQEKIKKQQQQQAIQSQGIFEPIAKKARGMLGMKKKVHDSERRVEMPKTPSN